MRPTMLVATARCRIRDRLVVAESTPNIIRLNLKCRRLATIERCGHRGRSSSMCKGKRLGTHIWMVSDLLNNLVVEMTGIAKEITEGIRVLQAPKYIVDDGNLGAFAELHSCLLRRRVQILNPLMMLRRRGRADVLLEDNDVRVGDGLRDGGAHDRCATIAIRFDLEHR